MRIKKFENFKHEEIFLFEEKVINPILDIIRNNEAYLIENKDQLAKIGFMFNTLWYAGRVCWGYSGILIPKKLKDRSDDNDDEYHRIFSCEDNPKYKLEDYNDEVYNAWAMHVSDDIKSFDYDSFKELIVNGEKLTELDKKLLKVNKTFDDWVEIKLDPNYRYKSIYPNRRAVSNHMICINGNVNSWNNEGYMIEDRDISLVGDWKNAKFTGEIKEIVDRILLMPELKLTLDSYHSYVNEERKKIQTFKSFKGELGVTDEEFEELMTKLRTMKTGKVEEKPKEKPYQQYHPISKSSNFYAIYDRDTQIRLGLSNIHKSYIDAAIEIAKEIVEHSSKESKENVEHAKCLLTRYNIVDYSSELPKKLNKEFVKEQVEDSLINITDMFSLVSTQPQKGEYFYHFNDDSLSAYGDNSFSYTFSLKGFNIKKGLSNNIDVLKGTPIYNDLQSAINRFKRIDDIKYISTYIDVDDSRCELNISLQTNNDSQVYFNNKIKKEEDLVKEGFQVGKYSLSLELDNLILSCNKTDGAYNKTMTVLDKNWNKITSYSIDERNFNTIRNSSHAKSGKVFELNKWIMKEHDKMKKSDKEYGDFTNLNGRSGKEGTKYLLATDFFIWLKNNQKNLNL